MFSFLRLPTTNGDLIITKSHGSHGHLSNAGPSVSSQSTSPQLAHQPSNYHMHSSMKLSPTHSSSQKPQLSPSGSENSHGELLSDSPSK